MTTTAARTIHDTLGRALRQWLRIRKFSGLFGKKSLHEFHANLTVEELQEAVDLDDTGVTAAGVLTSLLDEYTAERGTTLAKILARDLQLEIQLERCRRLRRLLARPEVAEPLQDFQAAVLAALEAYGARDDAKALAANLGDLGLIRRDCLRSMKKLVRYQFLRAETQPIAGKYNPHVYQFLNVNSIVEAVARQPEFGVTLCIVRDPEPEHSFFAFAAYNGGTLTILTDRPDWAHPMQKQMVRRPDRYLERRWGQHHFPYELLEMEWSHKSVHIPREGLILHNLRAARMKKVTSLEPVTVVWLVMMFSEIERELFRENRLLDVQAYTGEMVQDQLPTRTALATREGFQPLTLPPVTGEDLRTEKLAEEWENEPTGKNQAFEDRYAAEVPDEFLNLIWAGKKLLLQPPSEQRAGAIYRVLKNELAGMRSTDFGTLAELAANKRWVGRYNQAQFMGALAQEEFDRRAQETYEWFRAACIKNREEILAHAVRFSWKVTGPYRGHTPDAPTFGHTGTVEREHEMAAVRYDHTGHPSTSHGWHWTGNAVVLGHDKPLEETYVREVRCCVTGARRPTIQVSFMPRTPTALAALCGVPLADLPDVLRDFHWLDDLYSGNSILQKLDPLEWVLKNPWKERPLVCRVYLAKSGWNQLAKQHGAPEPENWDKLRRWDDKRHPDYTPPSRYR